MKKNNKIIYLNLEEKYIESAVDCAVYTKMQDNAFLHDLGYTKEIIQQDFSAVFNDPFIFKTTVIAIDQSKGNYVCGIFPGQDFCDYYQQLNKPSIHEQANVFKKIALKIYEPIKSMNYKQGEFIVGKGLGVRQEYENQNIGQKLTKKFINNAKILGYQVGGSMFYNKASAHIALKESGFIVSELNLNEFTLIPDEYKRKLKNTEVYMIFLIINDKFDKQRIPIPYQIPML